MVAQRCASARPLLFVRVLLSVCLRSHVHAQLPSRRFYKKSCVPIAPLALPHAQCTQRTSAGRFVGLDAAPLLIFGLVLALAGSLTTHAAAAVYIDDGARARPFGCALLIAGGLNNRGAYSTLPALLINFAYLVGLTLTRADNDNAAAYFITIFTR